MRTGYLGGSFDPVHHGHLALAEACLEQAGLDEVVLVVAGAPPHKRTRRLAPAVHRLAMARLAVEDNPRLRVDDREVARSGVTYTIDTLLGLLAGAGPGDEVLWIIGADTLPELPTWRRAEEILDLVTVLTACRPGHDVQEALAGLRETFGAERTDRLAAAVVRMPLLEISSSGLRARARARRSLRYLVPEAVRRYVLENSLYASPG